MAGEFRWPQLNSVRFLFPSGGVSALWNETFLGRVQIRSLRAFLDSLLVNSPQRLLG
jgi:hypothetical protein